jgi:hypothetical protein
MQPNMRLLSETAGAMAKRPFSSVKLKIPKAIPAMMSASITTVKKVSAELGLSVNLSIKNACRLK